MKVAEFWAWFVHHEATVRQALQGSGPDHDEEADDVDAVVGPFRKAFADHGLPLTFQLGLADEETLELVITADGDRDKFPLVEAVVAAAPKVEGWTILAFRQPHPDPSCLRIEFQTPSGLVTLDTSTVLFQFRSPTPDPSDDGRLAWSVDLFVPGGRIRGNPNKDPRLGAVFILLDAVLGEVVVEMQLGEIALAGDLTEGAARGASPLHELRAALAARSADA